MNRMQRTTRMVAILALAMILVGCNTPTVVVPPTQDIPSVRTEAASTVIAKITIEAALNPSPTTAATQTAAPAVITATLAPTDTPAAALPSLTPTRTATVRVGSGGTGTGTGTGGVVYPTATRRAGPDQAQLLGQTPKDGQVFNPSNDFDAVFTFKNVGTSTWNTNFRINAVTKKGTVMSRENRYMVRDTVKPGETTKIIADMVAPTSAGRYVQYWELANDNNAVFYAFYVVIDVK